MRLTTLILIAAIMQVSATTLAQKITLDQTNISLEKVFKVIRKQTGYNVFYTGIDIKSTKNITINVRDQPLEEVLKTVLAGQELTYDIEDRTIVVKKRKKSFFERVKAAFAAIDIFGRVVDERGLPLPGATIKLKDETQATSSDRDGVFTLKKIDEKAILVISSIGYQTKEISVKANLGDIRLEVSNSKLDEVKVIAYGTTTERLSTGSISSVSAAIIDKQPVTNILSAIQGRVPGLQISSVTGLPGGSYTVKLRGVNSLTGNTAPLYIVDGIEYPSATLNKLAGLDAAQNSSPLNDINNNDIESITVLKDAAATAIYGARGANGVILITMKKGKVGDTKVNVNAYTGIGQNTRRLQVMNTEQYLAMRREAYKNGGFVPDTQFAPDLTVWDQSAYTDWQKEIVGKTATYHDMQASVSGGSGGTTFLIGAGYHVESTDFSTDPAEKKAAVNFNIGHVSKNKKFNALLTGSYVNDRILLPTAELTAASAFISPNQPPLLQNGKLVFINGANAISALYRPYHSEQDNLVANGSLSYIILPGLAVKSTFGYNSITSNETQQNPRTTYDPANTFVSSSSSFGDNRIKTWNIEPQITYEKEFGKGKFNALIGSTIQSSFNHGTQYSATGFVNDAFLSDIQAAKTVTISNLSDANIKYGSFFARMGYNWDNKYIVDLTGRRDGSSRFGPGKQYGNFGASGVAWVFSKENFIAKALPFLSFGKLRASYGIVGNAPSLDYRYLSQWSVVNSAYDGISGLYPVNLFNDQFAWEKTTKKELGIDLEFFRGRISFNAAYYDNRSSNQLVNYTLPYTTGFSGIYSNLPATIENNGWEFGFNTVNIRSKSLQWTTNFNFSAPRNKLVDFPNLATSSYSDTYVIGQPVYLQKLYHFYDVNPATGIYRFQGAAGPTQTPSVKDKITLFDPTPRFYGGIGNNFQYKGFDLDFFFTYTRQKALDNQTTSGGMTNIAIRFLDRWQKPGDISQNQKISVAFDDTFAGNSYMSSSDKNLVDASFIRLKNVSLAYNIPTSYMEKIHFKSGRIYFQAQNLLTITSFKGLDPETGNTATAPLRIMTLGLQFTF